MAFALWYGLSHVRFLDFAAFIIVPILAPYLKVLPPHTPELEKPWLNAAIMAAVVAWAVFSSPTERALQQQIDEQYPKVTLQFMRRDDMQGRVFNSVEFGGYMKWNTPELKPFTDGHGEIFIYNGIFYDYVRAVSIRQPLEVFEKYRIDYVLLARRWPLAYLLEHSLGWGVVYSDNVAVFFQRAAIVGEGARVSTS
jgi:hypothetical protein